MDGWMDGWMDRYSALALILGRIEWSCGMEV